MMQMQIWRRAVAASVLLIGVSAASHADTPYDENRPPHELCASCHGLEGNTRFGHFPRIAGLPQAYIAKQVRDFRSGARGNDLGYMQGAVNLLAAADIDAVARHFSRQKAHPQSGDAVAKHPGARLFQKGDPARKIAACASCHDGGVAPRLWGQNAAYLTKQLNDFRAHRRRNDEDAVMRTLAARLTPHDIALLVAYLASPETDP